MEIVHRLIDVASHMEHDNSDYFRMTIVDFKVVANVLGSLDKGQLKIFSRDSDSTTTNVRPFVRLSVCPSVQNQNPQTSLNQHNITLNITTQHHHTHNHAFKHSCFWSDF